MLTMTGRQEHLRLALDLETYSTKSLQNQKIITNWPAKSTARAIPDLLLTL